MASIFKVSSTTVLTTVLITAISFFTSIITARALGPEGRGLLSGALLIATLAGNTALLGLANTFVYHQGAERIFNYKKFFIFSLFFISLFSASLAYFGLKLSSEVQLHQHLYLILMMAVLSGIYGYFIAISQLNHELHFFNVMRLGLVVGNLILLGIVISTFESLTFVEVLITQIAVNTLLMLCGVFWAKKNSIWQSHPNAKVTTTWREMFSYGIKHHGTVLLSIMLINFDKLVLLKIGTIVEYGFYALAFTTSRLIGAVQEATSTALYAKFAGRDIQLLSKNVNQVFRITFIPMLFLATLGAAISPWLIPFVYGEAFASVTIPFSILLFECVVGGASWTLAQRFNAGGRPGLVFFRQLISVIPILATLPFLPHENIGVSLSILMLVGALLRLCITLCIYPYALNEPIPKILPNKSDIKSVCSVFNI